MSELPKGITEEVYNQAKVVIVAGFGAEASPDDIKTQLFTDGIPFSKLATVYKSVTETEGLVLKSVDIKKNVDAAIEAVGFDFKESYATLEAFMDETIATIKGATKMRLSKAVRALFKINNAPYPKRVGTKKGRMGKINRAIINAFAENKDITKAGLMAIVEPLTEKVATAENYVNNNFRMAYALSHGLTAENAMKELANTPEEVHDDDLVED